MEINIQFTASCICYIQTSPVLFLLLRFLSAPAAEAQPGWFSQADATTPYWRAPGTAGSLLNTTTKAQGSVLAEKSDSIFHLSLLVAYLFAPVN